LPLNRLAYWCTVHHVKRQSEPANMPVPKAKINMRINTGRSNINTEKLIQQYGNNARQRILSSFSSRSMAQTYAAIYDNVFKT